MGLKSEFHPGEIPDCPGVYVFRDRFGKVIYVGKARNLRRRLSSYFQPSRQQTADPKLRSLINSIYQWNYETVRTEDEALILESRLIKSYAPYYNILMRDDKRYLLLKLDRSEKFPTLKLARLKKPDGAEYFGPFPNGSALKATLDFLLRYFGLRSCRSSEPDAETRKHCLPRAIKQCCSPCTGAVSSEQYQERLEQALAVLNGDISGLKNQLTQDMKSAAEACQFEKAARLRDVLSNLDAVFGRKNRIFANPELPDTAPGLVGINDLRERLGLSAVPHRIVCFDISNILGQLAVASMVSFLDGRPDRQHYRRFRIQTVHQSDDFAMMSEVVRRHFGRLLSEKQPLPDLVMVDGGKGQLSSALHTLIEIGCPPLPLLGLAEKNEEIYLPGRYEPLVLSRHTPALKLLQSVRDESHRFAITYHRSLRLREIEKSILDDIEGIGKVRKMALLRAFGSIANLRRASAAEISSKVPGLGDALAEKIKQSVSRKSTKKLH